VVAGDDHDGAVGGGGWHAERVVFALYHQDGHRHIVELGQAARRLGLAGAARRGDWLGLAC